MLEGAATLHLQLSYLLSVLLCHRAALSAAAGCGCIKQGLRDRDRDRRGAAIAGVTVC